MQLSDAMRKRIKNLLQENNLKVSNLHDATGVSSATLSYFMNGKRELINITTLTLVCKGFNIKLKDFFDDPLFNNVEQD